MLLTEIVSESEKLNNDKKQYSVELTFAEQNLRLPAVIYSYQEGNLVALACIRSNEDFLEFSASYPEYQEWAKDQIYGLFHDEYYMIQKMNNQLIDAQRKLTRSNRRLEQALKENKEINDKLDEARVIAERASRSKTNFLANMSHDIRTPMNAIVGLTDLIQHNLDNPEILDNYIEKLRSSSQYLLDLINDILDLSKIESGSMELKMEPMDVGMQIEQVVMIARSQITKKNLEFSVDGDGARYGYVMGDPVRLRQILMNIFSNAVKYTPEGGSIRFIIRESGSSEEEWNYQFIIEDSGIGMSQEFLEHIFDPFARAEASVREIQGTGLGMAITKNIVDAMNGKIHVYSEPGKGSRFEIFIPFEVCKEECIQEEVSGVKEKERKKGLSDLNGRYFLCAEDNELNAEILKAMLEMKGAECDIYENGKLLVEAFEMANAGQYDAILMDVQMPVMDGYEATRQIRIGKNPLGKSIPIIAMTANAFKEDEEKCLEAGMDAHMAKPVDVDKMERILFSVLK